MHVPHMRKGLLFGLVAVACHHTSGSTRSPRSSPLLSLASGDEIFAQPLGGLLAQMPLPGATFCVALRQRITSVNPGDLSPALLQALSSDRRVVGMRDCPPTAVSGAPVRDRTGRYVDQPPPGHTNPFRVIVYDDEPDSLAAAVVRLELWRGTSGSRYRCVPARSAWRCLSDHSLPP